MEVTFQLLDLIVVVFACHLTFSRATVRRKFFMWDNCDNLSLFLLYSFSVCYS